MSDPKMKLSAKIEERVKERDKLAFAIETDINCLALKINKFIDHDLATYEMLNSPDSLYHDSPISRAFTYEWIKQYMIKKDLDFIGYVLDGKATIKNFVERATEASGWVMRFTKPLELKKTGIEAIL